MSVEKTARGLGWTIWACVTIGIYAAVWTVGWEIIPASMSVGWWIVCLAVIVGGTCLYIVGMLSLYWLLRKYVKIQKVNEQ